MKRRRGMAAPILYLQKFRARCENRFPIFATRSLGGYGPKRPVYEPEPEGFGPYRVSGVGKAYSAASSAGSGSGAVAPRARLRST
jgi:hypothetical protein